VNLQTTAVVEEAAIASADGEPEEPAAPTDPTEPTAAEAEGSGAVAFGGSSRTGAFQVHLHNFDGPFDLLLQLISKHKLDVTEVALHQVTDDFIAHIRALGSEWDLGQATEFLVVAATLLDLKAARLLPAAEVDDEEDLALLEARDLLFARLLQYRAYKEVAIFIAEHEAAAAKRHPRSVALEERFAKAIPEVVLGLTPQQFAELAVRAMSPKPVPTVSIDHIHAPKVSVREHAALLRMALMKQGQATFRHLSADCQSTLEVVARFLALLELYREGVLSFEQVEALGELHVRWVGGTGEQQAGADIDEYGDEDDEQGQEQEQPADGGAAGAGEASSDADA
jgi:segregation and condensation protein A